MSANITVRQALLAGVDAFEWRPDDGVGMNAVGTDGHCSPHHFSHFYPSLLEVKPSYDKPSNINIRRALETGGDGGAGGGNARAGLGAARG